MAATAIMLDFNMDSYTLNRGTVYQQRVADLYCTPVKNQTFIWSQHQDITIPLNDILQFF